MYTLSGKGYAGMNFDFDFDLRFPRDAVAACRELEELLASVESEALS